MFDRLYLEYEALVSTDAYLCPCGDVARCPYGDSSPAVSIYGHSSASISWEDFFADEDSATDEGIHSCPSIV
jgi:hypothetical protein